MNPVACFAAEGQGILKVVSGFAQVVSCSGKGVALAIEEPTEMTSCARLILVDLLQLAAANRMFQLLGRLRIHLPGHINFLAVSLEMSTMISLMDWAVASPTLTKRPSRRDALTCVLGVSRTTWVTLSLNCSAS